MLSVLLTHWRPTTWIETRGATNWATYGTTSYILTTATGSQSWWSHVDNKVCYFGCLESNYYSFRVNLMKLLTVLSYSLPSIVTSWSRCTGSQLTAEFKSFSRSSLPLLSARPQVTFTAEERHRPSTSTKLYCLVTEAHRVNDLPKVVMQLCPCGNWTRDHRSNALPLHHCTTCKLRQSSKLCRTVSVWAMGHKLY